MEMNEYKEVTQMKRRALLSLVLAMALLVVTAVPAMADNPTVTITVKAQTISITNSKATWDLGTITTSTTKYFSADGNEDVDWSRITNTGNVAVDVAIQGTDFEGGDYDWTLAATAGDQQYKLFANKQATPTVYDVEVKNAPTYSNIVTSLAAAGTNDWSMKFEGPTGFHASDDGLTKTATVTLVASKS